jgi:tetratricopeptide (TPR) repeat protein
MRWLALGAGLSLSPLGAAAMAQSAPSPSAPKSDAPVGKGGFADIEGEGERFMAATRDYKATINHLVKHDYLEQRKKLQGKYESQASVEEKAERENRLKAIALHEAFLAKYPNDARWTPDVIFRLAELYFEKSEDEYLAATEEYDKATRTGAANPPAAPQKNYQKTIDLYKQLITQFPQYRLVDAAAYLLGYCYGEQNQEPEAKQAFLGLACANKFNPLDPPQTTKVKPTRAKLQQAEADDPYKGCRPVRGDSKFLPETWTRLGEYHFDDNELDLAIVAYRKVLEFKDSNLYDKALYKLAWSYYRADRS